MRGNRPRLQRSCSSPQRHNSRDLHRPEPAPLTIGVALFRAIVSSKVDWRARPGLLLDLN